MGVERKNKMIEEEEGEEEEEEEGMMTMTMKNVRRMQYFGCSCFLFVPRIYP